MITLVYIAMVLSFIEAKPIIKTTDRKSFTVLNLSKELSQDSNVLRGKNVLNDETKNEIIFESMQKERKINLPQIRRAKRNPEASTERSPILHSICARVQTSGHVLTNGLDVADIIDGQSDSSLHTIYSPCSDDVFFDSWGG